MNEAIGQMIPAQPGFAAVMERHSKFGKRMEWIELEPVIAWVLLQGGGLVPVTVKHGRHKIGGAILNPDGKVVDTWGTHDNLAEWQRCHGEIRKEIMKDERRFMAEYLAAKKTPTPANCG